MTMEINSWPLSPDGSGFRYAQPALDSSGFPTCDRPPAMRRDKNPHALACGSMSILLSENQTELMQLIRNVGVRITERVKLQRFIIPDFVASKP